MDPIVKKLMENHRVLSEMAEPWKFIESRLKSDSSREVLLHLLKIYYWKDTNNGKDFNGWKGSVYSNSIKLNRLKGKNRYPAAPAVYKAIWEAWGDTFDSMEHQLNGDPAYKELPYISIDLNAISFCSDYISWYSKVVSVDGAVSKYEVYEEIDKLLDKYDR